MRRNSITPLRHSSTSGDSVRMPMPSVICVAQPICGRGIQPTSGLPSAAMTGLRCASVLGMATSIRHMRQLPGMDSLG